MRGSIAPQQPQPIVQKQEGCFLQTLNAGCGCLFLLIGFVFLAILFGGGA